jgi:hypothetical protein
MTNNKNASVINKRNQAALSRSTTPKRPSLQQDQLNNTEIDNTQM